MSDALSFAEIDGQHAELLPARTVLSMFSLGDTSDDVTVVSACATNAGSGLLGIIPTANVACTPSTVITR